MTYIPYDMQRIILSFLGITSDLCSYIHKGIHGYINNKQGRCLCFTSTGKRCKNKINYFNKFFCYIHNPNDNFIEALIKLKENNADKLK